MSFILGISAFYHDSAACLLQDRKLVAAAQEERFTRKKHDASFPTHAVRFCLESQGITIDDIALVVFYEKPFIKFDRIIETYARKSPKGFLAFRKAMKAWISEKLWIPSIIKQELQFKGQLIFSEHHEAHAASAFFASPFSEAAILIMDGVGEKTTITLAIGKANKITLIEEQRFPHSLGLFYSAFTYYCGFKVNSGEYKLMGLSPYGEPKYKERIYEHLIHIDEQGVLQLNMKYFDFEAGLKMTSRSFDQLFGQPRRTPESDFTQFYKDMARSAQEVLEEVILLLVGSIKKKTGLSKLCLAGGVALNCKVNQRIQESGIFDELWIQPASGDCGGALGAAYIGAYQYYKQERLLIADTPQNHIYKGLEFSNAEILEQLEHFQIHSQKLKDQELMKEVAHLLNQKKIIGWFQGAMEFGPRALGSRSILASPKFKDMQQHVNLKIKMREGFRPFAPMVLEEKAGNWFNINSPSKYMLITYTSTKAKEIPSCIHLDDSARVQTVSKEDNPKIHSLITEFEKVSSIPVLINTSFNVRGEPIVCTVEDALRCFFATEIDYLVLGNYLISKNENEPSKQLKFKKTEYDLD